MEIKWKVEDNGCWICTSHRTNKRGYPKIRVGKKLKLMSHVMYERVHGEGTIGKFHVLHSCDNPRCINPSHLSLGTHQENMRQMSERGRVVTRRGTNHHFNKLSVEDVLFIRSSDVSSRVLASQFGVCKSTILRIKNNIIWKEVI